MPNRRDYLFFRNGCTEFAKLKSKLNKRKGEHRTRGGAHAPASGTRTPGHPGTPSRPLPVLAPCSLRSPHTTSAPARVPGCHLRTYRPAGSARCCRLALTADWPGAAAAAGGLACRAPVVLLPVPVGGHGGECRDQKDCRAAQEMGVREAPIAGPALGFVSVNALPNQRSRHRGATSQPVAAPVRCCRRCRDDGFLLNP